MSRGKPVPYATVPKPMDPRGFYRFSLTAPLKHQSTFWLDAHDAVR